jgi:TPP-dependent pyruvate/acetoin dehydrogenase alpha subunit
MNGLQAYASMLRIRLFEEQVAKRFRQGELPGFVHLSTGQEAVAVGVCSALSRDDFVATTHRGHGHVIAKGADMRKLAAELHGSPEGACRGLGGSMHLVDVDCGVLCAGAIVGGTIPLATGVAFAFKQQGKPHVAVSFFGDGAVNQGVFHECLNIASLWDLPILFACENNGYAEMTPASVHSKVEALSDHGRVYGITSIAVNGNDVEAVHAAAADAAARARQGGGPTLLEMLTYRVRGHFEGDSQKYKPAGEAEEWKARDPLVLYRSRLLEGGTASPEQLEQVTHAVEAEVDAAFEGHSRETPRERAELEAVTYGEPTGASAGEAT